MLTEQNAREVIGTTAYSADGDKLGKVGQLFLDDQTGRPEFVTVNTGLFGTKETFIPVSDASFNGDRLTLPFGKDRISDAPKVDAEGGHLDQSEERRLYEYYGMSYDKSSSESGYAGDRTGNAGYAGTTGDAGTLGNETRVGTSGTSGDSARTGDLADADTAGFASGTGRSGDYDTSGTGRSEGYDTSGTGRSEGYDTSGPTTDDAMTRSEESVRVGTASEEAGRVRLRKYVTTEEETHTVPVRKEKAVLEREPVTDANVDAATSGPDLSEEEHEVVLNEERVVVEKEVNPVERVRLGTETVTDEETVTEEVRKEHIEADGDVNDRR